MRWSGYRKHTEDEFACSRSTRAPPRMALGALGLRLRRAHNRDRTGDLILTKDVLYRLSYVSGLHLHLQTSPAERETGLEPATSSLEG